MSARSLNWLKFGGLVALAFAPRAALRRPARPAPELARPQQAAGSHGHRHQSPARSQAPSIPAARPLQEPERRLRRRGRAVKPSVVFISRSAPRRQPARSDPRVPPGMEQFFPQLRQRPEIEQGSGSGFIVSADGYILTNNHVVEGADKVTVRLLDRRSSRPRWSAPIPTPTSRSSRSTPRASPPAALGNSDDARVGEWVLAVGNPLGDGLTFTVTSGIISAKGRGLQRPAEPQPGQHPGLHPDRRGDQPRQLGRPAGQRAGRGHRHQLRHRQRDRLQLGLRLRHPDQPGPHGDGRS